MEKNKLDIPVTWVYEQIKAHPGMYAAAWNRLLDLWDEYLLKTRFSQQPIENEDQSSDGYVTQQQHKNFGGMNNG